MNVQISASMNKLSDDNQQGTISTILAQPLIVKAAYANGTPVIGLPVSFNISIQPEGRDSSGARLSAVSVTTDANGQAKTMLTLGDRVGTYSVTASNPNLINSPLTFTAAANDWKAYNYTCESPHEYQNNFTNTWEIKQPGAIRMQVHFERYALAPGDTIYVMDKNNNNIVTYSSDNSDVWSPMVEGDVLKIKLVTNKSLTAYGFKVDKYRANGGSPLPEDTIPPAGIINLTALKATYNSIQLTWTAPGDDGNTGQAAMFYDIRYSTSPINDSNWANAAQFQYEPVPANAGRNQYTTVSDLAQNTLYYFGIKTYDDRSAASALSNIAIGKTNSTPPVLDWSKMSDGYARDGVNPDSSQCGASFTFMVKYSDADNDAPAPGYPRVAIFAGDNLFGSFTMAQVDPLDNNYKDGKLYTYTVKLPLTGVYSYQFIAYDINNVPAQGIPTWKQNGPVVSNAPVMKWLGTAYMGYEYDGLEPHKGNSETQFIFKIRYMDVDGDAPDIDSPRLHLFVGGEDITPRKTGYIMKPLTSANNGYKAGVIYSCSVQLMNNGEYSYEFRGEDSNGVSSGGVACTRMMGPTISGRNVGPTLSWPVGKNTGVVPVIGEPKQVFVFEVVYADINNDAPDKGYPVVKIRKNGETIDTLYPMTLVGTGTYAKGILYRAEISLAPGIYYHSFDAKDSYGLVSTGVPRSMQKGPYVAYAPSLSNGEHTPVLGQVSQTRFTFKVKYMDACNYIPYPGYPKVHILCGDKEIPGSPFSMSSSDSSKPEIGKQYQYTGILPYVSDVYTYYFEVMNYLKVPGISTMKYQGPKVLLDTTSPAEITILQTSNPQVGSITLTWAAPGDDGTSGTAFAYDIRYATVTITNDNWDKATQCQNEPTPLSAGTQQSLVITGLSPYTRYYFAIKTKDEVGNLSGVSNVAVGTTTAYNVLLGLTQQLSAVTGVEANVLNIAPGTVQGAVNATWSVEDDDANKVIGRIEGNGLFRAIGTGICRIKATYGGRTGTLMVMVKRPARLGNTNNQYDNLIINAADANGIEPQLLKAQIHQESGANFNPNAYRYEPYTVDYQMVSGAKYILNDYPYRHYRMAAPAENGHPAQTEGEKLVQADITPRNIYQLVDSNRNGYHSAQEIINANPKQGNSWNHTLPFDVTAQTTIAASYGLTQVLYTTAIAPMGWNNYNGGQPHLLFEPKTVIDLGAGYLKRKWKDTGNWDTDWNESLEDYNGGATYPADVRRYVSRYLPQE